MKIFNLNKQNLVIDYALTVLIILMLSGFFFSRALLSTAMIIAPVFCLLPAGLERVKTQWKTSLFPLLSIAFFLAYLLSGLWSTNLEQWGKVIVDKLPFLILPFVFITAPLKKPKFRNLILHTLLLQQLLLIFWSCLQYVRNMDYYLEGYALSRQIPTTVDNDHIRFGLLLVFSCLAILFRFQEKQVKIPIVLKVAYGVTFFVFTAFIHFLAAKTGLIAYYIMLFFYGVFVLWKYNKWMTVALFFLLGILPVVAYYKVNTFKIKTHYVMHEIEMIKSSRLDYNLSDAGRLITYNIGLELIKEHPWIGVGAGDLMHEMNNGYDEKYPEVVAKERYGPINQYLHSALAVGVPLSLILVLMSLCGYFKSQKGNMALKIVNVILIFSLMVESMLEIQYGIFIYLFMMLYFLNYTPYVKDKAE